MTLYARSFENQGNIGFVQLFRKIFPTGTDAAKLSRFIDCRRAVEAKLYAFELDEQYQVGCYCSDCDRHSFIPVFDIAVALQTQSVVDCCCEGGSLLPMVKPKAS